jgi:hypothetical protein
MTDIEGNLKKTKIISIFIIFLLCFPLHFLYDLFPNSFFALITPVNESIWEHMKLPFTSILINGILEYFILKKYHIKFNNFFIDLFITSVISIFIFLCIYLPIYYTFGEHMIITLIILFISIAITQFISYYILQANNLKWLNYFSIILIITCYIIFGYLTYDPPKSNIFLDTENNVYGINKYFI